MKNAVNFLENMKENDGVVIIFNNDGDGICACSILMKFLKGKIKKDPYIISQPMPMDKNLIQRVKTTIPTKIIFLDLAADQQQNIVNQMKAICDIMVVDHHRFVKDLNTMGIVHVNPRFSRSDKYQSTSYVTYKLCSKIKDMSKYLWIAATGMVSDYDLTDSKDVVSEIKKEYKIENDNLYETIFGRLADIISANTATKNISGEGITHIFVASENPEDILSNEKLKKSYSEIEKEISDVISDADKNAEVIKNFVFYNITSKYSIRSPISTRLSEKFPEKTVVIYQKLGSKIKLSIRNQKGKVDITKLLKKATKNLNASAGGHEKAAGAIINAKDWEIFKERFISGE